MTTAEFIQKSAKPRPNVIWPVRIIGVLLVIQAILISSTTILFARQIEWEREFNDVMLSIAALDIVMWGATLAPIILLLFVAAIAFLLYRRFAWLLAMTLQGLLLLRCLILYFGTESHLRDSTWVHLLMLYAIILVLYLNTTDIRLSFTAENDTTGNHHDTE